MWVKRNKKLSYVGSLVTKLVSTILNMMCSLPHTCCLQNWFQNFCCIFYALLLCSRCNIKLSPPIKANAAKISTQEFLTKRLRINMKLLIILYITADYSNILFTMSSNKWFQDFAFASFFKSILCCLKGSSNKKISIT